MDINKTLENRILTPEYIASLVHYWGADFATLDDGYRGIIEFRCKNRPIVVATENFPFPELWEEVKSKLVNDALLDLIYKERYLMETLSMERGEIPMSEWTIVDYQTARFDNPPKYDMKPLDFVREYISPVPSDLNESNAEDFLGLIISTPHHPWKTRLVTPSDIDISSKEA